MHVVHVVSQNSQLNGYARRTQELVKAQRAAGIHAEVVTHTDGRFAWTDAQEFIATVSDLLGTPDEVWAPLLGQQVALAAVLYRALQHRLLCPAQRPDVLHAHVPWPCALAAAAASRVYGVPWVYEVRGLQEESALVDGLWAKDSLQYQGWRRMETWARTAAAKVMAISPALVADAAARGAHAPALTPNAVDTETFVPLDAAAQAAVRSVYGLHPTRRIVAYFGSLRPLEGVHNLVAAAPALRDHNIDVLICGDGTDKPALQAAARATPTPPTTPTDATTPTNVMFMDPVPATRVGALMASVDAVAITRPDTVVTRAVTPLKPLEVLASGTPVVSSDLPALQYVGRVGTLFYPPGDQAALVAACVEATSPGRKAELGAAGREWVKTYRSWASVVVTNKWVYSLAGAGAGARAHA